MYKGTKYSHKGKQLKIEDKPNKREALKSALADHDLTEGEFKAMLSSIKVDTTPAKKIKHKRTKTKSIKLLAVSDEHIGHEKFDEELFSKAVAISKDCDIILLPGDHLEGMSGRPGHIYELAQVGYQQQIKRCRDLYGLIEKPMYGIDGNHDQWYQKKNNAGVIVGEELARSIKNYNHLGQNEGNLHIDGLHIMLFHPGDGSAYATSYKSQKLVESFSGGQKPHIVFEGHYHKALYHFIRNVHAFESGTMCGQTEFMRGKKLPAHKGFWEVVVRWNDKGVDSITNTFHPGYE